MIEGNVKIDEDLLLKYAKGIPIDYELPFRLQKTQLFERLGFPVRRAGNVPIRVTDSNAIKDVFERFFQKELPFFIVTSPKPMTTVIPPLLRVNAVDHIIFRDMYGSIVAIQIEEVFAKIQELPKGSWVEFVRNIWRKNTIAGRLLYVSGSEQLLEIQRGVEIAELGNNRKNSAYLSVALSYFDPANPVEYSRMVCKSGFQGFEVRAIIDYLGDCFRGFERLRQVASLPALEFGYTQQEGLIVIDVDWPIQYQR